MPYPTEDVALATEPRRTGAGGNMKIRSMFLCLWLLTSLTLANAQVPQDIKEELRTKDFELRESIMVSPLLVIAVLHFPKAKLWVLTYLHMVSPDRWAFRDADIQMISREINGEVVTLYERKEEI